MTHVSVRAPCGARVGGLMFSFRLSPRPAASEAEGWGVDGPRPWAYNRGLAMSLSFSPGLRPLTPLFLPGEEGARGFHSSFQLHIDDRPAPCRVGFGLGGLRLGRREIDGIAKIDGIAARRDLANEVPVVTPESRLR